MKRQKWESSVQEYNDGVVKIYNIIDENPNGNMPIEVIQQKKLLRYHERTIGINRHYTALQSNARVDMVLRVPLQRDISTQDIAIPNNGLQYGIKLIQYPEKSPTSMDLTLERLEQDYGII